MHILHPKSHAARVQQSSYVWWSGKTDTSTSFLLKSTDAHADVTEENTFLWQSITHFELPVVPEVKRYSQQRSASVSGINSASDAPPVFRRMSNGTRFFAGPVAAVSSGMRYSRVLCFPDIIPANSSLKLFE